MLKANPGLTIDRFQPTVDGYILQLPLQAQSPSKRTTLKFIHTPGHTPGAQCILVNDCSLFSGDTIFVGSCGRVDFPESNPQLMWHSLSNKIKSLDDKVGFEDSHALLQQILLKYWILDCYLSGACLWRGYDHCRIRKIQRHASVQRCRHILPDSGSLRYPFLVF